ncbi:MAG: hypothetical protein OSJ83_06435 [Clostridia bacterium]|nr:hypothetical protein [Clostridia bacterium]
MALAALLTALFVGCGSESVPSLRCDGITLCIGESRDILHYVYFTPAVADERDVELSADGDCVEIDGTVVTAVRSGECSVTVRGKGGEAAIRVSCVYREAGEPALEASRLIQTASSVSDISEVTFSVRFIEPVDPELEVVWSVDGAAAGSGREFSYRPSGYGEFKVAAVAGGANVGDTVRVYRPANTEVTFAGEKEQRGTYSYVSYSARHFPHPDNPRAVYVWRVNGEARGDEANFRFMPSESGEYTVSLEVNGKDVPLGNNGTVTASDAYAVECAVAFDDRDGVYIEWAGDRIASRVSVIAPNGVRSDLCATDARHAYLFGRGTFDATELIDVFAAEPGVYDITVCFDGESECVFSQYPIRAKEFADDKPFVKNTFVSDIDDGCELIDDGYAIGLREIECYIANGGSETLDAMMNYAAVLGMTGRSELDGNIAKISFDDYVNAPDRFDEMPDITRMYTELPHIEYDSSARRPQSYVFDIDRIKRGVEVENSSQLVTVATRGLCPVPVFGSPAQTVYASVRAKLSGIIGARYTAERKIHAIYDWLQWVTVCVDDGTDRNCASNYAEAVFGYSTMQGGDARRAVVTSEGMAKCFSLMCAVEGIECMTYVVLGDTHYANKVKLDGVWYNVDAYAGKANESELGLARSSQLGTHRALLIDDAEAVKLGLYPALGEYAADNVERSFYLLKTKRDGLYVDRYLKPDECKDYATVKAIVFDCFASRSTGSVSVPVLAGIETYMVTTLGAELRLGDGLSEKDVDGVRDMILKAVNEYAVGVYGKAFPQNAVRITRIGDYLHIVASTFGMTAEPVE